MSEWSFPCLLVAKKGNDKHILCIDFRALDAQSELPSHPLIDLDEFMGDLGHHKKSNYFTTIDLKNAYLPKCLILSVQERHSLLRNAFADVMCLPPNFIQFVFFYY